MDKNARKNKNIFPIVIALYTSWRKKRMSEGSHFISAGHYEISYACVSYFQIQMTSDDVN